MTMDPRLYEKYSGRSGDLHSRLGAALSQSDAQQSRLTEQKSRSFAERRPRARYKVQIGWAIILLSVIAGAALLKTLFGR